VWHCQQVFADFAGAPLLLLLLLLWLLLPYCVDMSGNHVGFEHGFAASRAA
jgi:hypothetical protein